MGESIFQAEVRSPGVVNQLQIPYRTRRDADDRMPLGDIGCHNSTRADSRAGTNMNPGQECCMGPE